MSLSPIFSLAIGAGGATAIAAIAVILSAIKPLRRAGSETRQVRVDISPSDLRPDLAHFIDLEGVRVAELRVLPDGAVGSVH